MCRKPNYTKPIVLFVISALCFISTLIIGSVITEGFVSHLIIFGKDWILHLIGVSETAPALLTPSFIAGAISIPVLGATGAGCLCGGVVSTIHKKNDSQLLLENNAAQNAALTSNDNNNDGDLDVETYNIRLLYEIRDEFQRQANMTSDGELKTPITKIIHTIEEINKFLANNPSNAKALTETARFHIPAVLKLLNEFHALSDNLREKHKLRNKISSLLNKLDVSIEEELKRMLEQKMLETESEIAAVENLLKGGGRCE